MGLTKIYENKSLYKKKRKGFKVTSTWQKKQSRDQWNLNDISHQDNIMIPTLLQSVDEPDPGPKLLDKETYFRS